MSKKEIGILREKVTPFFFEKSLYSKNKLGTLYKQKTVIRRGVIKGTGTGQSPDHVVPVGNKMFLDCFYFVYS
jgi:hypothetical protein